ncbi:polysaccharide biosynthesis/export family protein [Salinimicrobium tongyeongense]|uniref:Polysaccharide biosynthesis/export family protein n=1 Tax=Salinimicrobium tongyeongense TaxID=2809707 RepID=A0ABY6NRF7_9FLAO|nr:polysaccharide biosynthesis/export family protein [Salinimicrobium tongyeongense]UZH55495.1 polysaccharide biosynthesis/export family protein [Salinimicrobium tongyeongense]
MVISKSYNFLSLYNYLVVLLGVLLVSSCSSRKDVVYFQDFERLPNMAAPDDFQAEIEINDILRVDVSSMNEELAAPFQLKANAQNNGSGGGNNAALTGYLVDSDGNINFPVLGEIHVAGKTREELQENLTTELRDKYLKDAVVRVRIVNFKVTVMGETGSQVINVTDERISVPQAIAMSGDISYDGKRDKILVIRQDNEELKYEILDLTSVDIFQNPFYYLKQNDIVYVEPTYRKVKSAGFITSWQGLVSIVTTAFSLFVLFNNI